MAVWIRFPELPIEFYEPLALLKIGKAIGLVLRIDANTINGVRGRFTRLCVQVNLDKPLIRMIYIGKLEQLYNMRVSMLSVSLAKGLDIRGSLALTTLEN